MSPNKVPPAAGASWGTPAPAFKTIVLVKTLASRKPNVISQTGFVMCLRPGDIATAHTSVPHSAKVPL